MIYHIGPFTSVEIRAGREGRSLVRLTDVHALAEGHISWINQPIILGVAPRGEGMFNPSMMMCRTPDELRYLLAYAVEQNWQTVAYTCPLDHTDLLAPAPNDDVIEQALRGLQDFTDLYAREIRPALDAGDYYLIGRIWATRIVRRIDTPRCASTWIDFHPPDLQGNVATVFQAGDTERGVISTKLTGTLMEEIRRRTSQVWPTKLFFQMKLES